MNRVIYHVLFTQSGVLGTPMGARAPESDVASREQGHHPDIAFGWGYCRVVFYTHKIKGLHENDFIMAAKVNGLER